MYADLVFLFRHSHHNVDYFIKMLKTYSIDYLIDVRSMPFSQYPSNYNKDV